MEQFCSKMAPTSLHIELTYCLALHHATFKSPDNEPALSLKKIRQTQDFALEGIYQDCT